MAKLTSKDVYRASATSLQPWAAANGFVGPEDSRRPGPWAGELSGVPVAFDLQVDKWGWNDREGSRFTINFEARFASETYRKRYGDLLRRRPSPEELAMAWSANQEPTFAETDRSAFAALTQRVLAKLPDAGEYPTSTTLDGQSGDPWMRYWDAADVVEWLSTFIVPRLPRILDELVLGEPKPMAMPEFALASLSVAVEGGHVVLRLSAPDARRLSEVLRTPWKTVTIQGPRRVVVLRQMPAVRGPIGAVEDASLEITWPLGRSTRSVLIEMLEAAPLGQPRPVEDRAGSARFDTGVMLEVHA